MTADVKIITDSKQIDLVNVVESSHVLGIFPQYYGSPMHVSVMSMFPYRVAVTVLI